MSTATAPPALSPLWASLADSPALLNWAMLVASAALVGHAVHRYTGLPRLLGYTIVGLVAGWIGFGDLPWPMQGLGMLLLQMALAATLLMAGTQLPLRWLLRQPGVLLQSLLESLLGFAAVAGLLWWIGQPMPIALGMGVVAMAASPSVVLRVTLDLSAKGPITDRSLTLATLSVFYALLMGGLLAAVGHLAPAEAHWLAAIMQLGGDLLLTLLWTAVATALLWPVLRWRPSNSDNTALYMLAVLAAMATIAQRWGGSAALALLLAGVLLRNLSPRPLVWPPAFVAANSMLNLLMFVLIASMAARVGVTPHLLVWALAAALVRGAAKWLGVVLGGWTSGLHWRRQWAVGCAQLPLSGVALLLASTLVAQWAATPGTDGSYAATFAALALPMVVASELVGALLMSLAWWQSGEAHRGIGPAALLRKGHRHDA